MAKQRPKQLEPGKTGPSKMGFDGEEDGWVLVKKQRVIIVLPSLPAPEDFSLEKPETFQSQAELRDGIADMHEMPPVRTMVPSLPLPEHCTVQTSATSQSQAEFIDVIADMQEPIPAHTMVPSLPLLEQFTLQKPAASQSQAELRDFIPDMHETTLVHTVVPSLPVIEPATFQSQAERRDVIADMHETTLVQSVEHSLPVPEHCILQKSTTSQPQADMYETTPFHTVVPSLPAPEDFTLQKPVTSQPQGELRDFVADAHETTLVQTVEPEVCPDFTSVDKPEIVIGRNLTTRKASGPRRSLQGCRMENRRRRKPIRFPRVMCSSVVMDNEKLRVVNLERKVERAGGLNEWVGSIGLGREFERMLRGERMSKFQVANLTMEKLKHMGALAVGPRRKLIHAIRCVYHPHCLRASFN